MKDLLQKLVDNTLTEAEFESVMEFVKDPKNRPAVETMMDRHFDTTDFSQKRSGEIDDNGSEELYEKISRAIAHRAQRKRLPNTAVSASKKSVTRYSYRVAASIALLIGLFLVDQDQGFLEVPAVVPLSERAVDAITLQRDDGTVEVIDEEGGSQVKDAKGNIIGRQQGQQMVYTGKAKVETLVYNTLTVPYGKRFEVLLSDGTKVHLNAGTSMRYPVQFIAGKKNREVFLNGEAYFEVAKDEAHPFLVSAGPVHVAVLGTEFNMSYYPEDAHINTVLVEGSVKLYEDGQENDTNAFTWLTPGKKAAWHRARRKMAIADVDTELYTAWKEGVLLFRNTTFNSIRKKLERHFDIRIENRYPFLEDQVYTASFREETIEEILDAFIHDTPFTYRSDDGTIIITKTKTTDPINN